MVSGTFIIIIITTITITITITNTNTILLVVIVVVVVVVVIVVVVVVVVLECWNDVTSARRVHGHKSSLKAAHDESFVVCLCVHVIVYGLSIIV